MNKKVILLLLLLIARTAPAAAAVEMQVLSFGIPPQQSPMELTKRWTPVLQYLSEKSGLTLQLKTAKDIPTYQQQVMEGQCDIAYMSPNSYVAANKASGYRAFAKEKGGKSVAIIVARKDGPITQLSQLSGQTMAFPSNTAFMATILPVRQLEEEKVAVKIQYVVSIDSVYRSVAKGLFAAGGGEARTFGALDPGIRDQLTLLWKSDDLPPFPFFAHPRVPAAALGKLQKAMIDMGQDVQGQALLKVVNIKALDKADDAEYNAVRKLNLPLEVK
jgi:phosphonate transport system substrate-binding protein